MQKRQWCAAVLHMPLDSYKSCECESVQFIMDVSSWNDAKTSRLPFAAHAVVLPTCSAVWPILFRMTSTSPVRWKHLEWHFTGVELHKVSWILWIMDCERFVMWIAMWVWAGEVPKKKRNKLRRHQGFLTSETPHRKIQNLGQQSLQVWRFVRFDIYRSVAIRVGQVVDLYFR